MHWNTTPTVSALKDAFGLEIATGRLIPRICFDWGKNPGSATALNEGAYVAWKAGARWVMNWSPEIDLTGERIPQIVLFAERHDLSVAGFLRRRWWERPQWHVVQNTAALWRLDALETVGRFAASAMGRGARFPWKGTENCLSPVWRIFTPCSACSRKPRNFAGACLALPLRSFGIRVFRMPIAGSSTK